MCNRKYQLADGLHIAACQISCVFDKTIAALSKKIVKDSSAPQHVAPKSAIKTESAKSRMAVEPIKLSAVTVADKRLRFLMFDRENVFYNTSDIRMAGCQPLFLGSDVLSGTSEWSKNSSRVHARFAKQGLATKVLFTGCRISELKKGDEAYFYSVHGLFTAVFEYHTYQVQRQCLLCLSDVWKTTSNAVLQPQLDIAYEVSMNNLILTHTAPPESPCQAALDQNNSEAAHASPPDPSQIDIDRSSHDQFWSSRYTAEVRDLSGSAFGSKHVSRSVSGKLESVNRVSCREWGAQTDDVAWPEAQQNDPLPKFVCRICRTKVTEREKSAVDTTYSAVDTTCSTSREDTQSLSQKHLQMDEQTSTTTDVCNEGGDRPGLVTGTDSSREGHTQHIYREGNSPSTSTEGHMPGFSRGQTQGICTEGQTHGICKGQPPVISRGKTQEISREQTQGISREGQTPGISSKGETPGISREGQTPGIFREGQTPGISREGQTPGISRDGQTSGISRDGQTSGISREGQTPGISRGQSPGISREGPTQFCSTSGHHLSLVDHSEGYVKTLSTCLTSIIGEEKFVTEVLENTGDSEEKSQCLVSAAQLSNYGSHILIKDKVCSSLDRESERKEGCLLSRAVCFDMCSQQVTEQGNLDLSEDVESISQLLSQPVEDMDTLECSTDPPPLLASGMSHSTCQTLTVGHITEGHRTLSGAGIAQLQTKQTEKTDFHSPVFINAATCVQKWIEEINTFKELVLSSDINKVVGGHGHGFTSARESSHHHHIQLEYVLVVLEFLARSADILKSITDVSTLSELLTLILLSIESRDSAASLLQGSPGEVSPLKTSVLTVFGKWLGEEFHRFEVAISQRVLDFKHRHINNISDLPPAAEVVGDLFPPCMVQFTSAWIGLTHLQVAEAAEMDHSYQRQIKEQSGQTSHNRNLYPVLQLVLELLNNSLVSGIAHVVYCKLRHAS